MRKNNWIVAAIAAVACGALLWAWFALGFTTTWTTRWISWSPWWAVSCVPLQRNGGAPATPLRSARGTDRDIPASFPRS